MAYDTEWSEGKRVELTDLNKDDRSRLRGIVGPILAGAALAALLILGHLIYAAKVWAAPRAQSQEQCMLFTDMVLVVAANAKNAIPRAQTIQALPDIYEMNSPDVREVARLIVVWLYDKTDPSSINTRDIVYNFAQQCLKTGGDMDVFLVGTGA